METTGRIPSLDSRNAPTPRAHFDDTAQVSFDDAILRWALKASSQTESSGQQAALMLTEARYRQLPTLVLADHKLSPLPDVFGPFPNLNTLVLRNNDLDRLPDSITRLVKLHTLILRECRFREIPQVIGKLGSLRTLDLADNQIDDKAGFANALPPLKHLDLRANLLSTIPHFVKRLDRDCFVDIGGNRIPAASLPSFLTNIAGGPRIVSSIAQQSQQLSGAQKMDWLAFRSC